MEIQESGENYLETILMLQTRKSEVRSIDIVNELGFSKPSISRAVSILKSNDYIIVDKLGNITLTKKGEEVASCMYERHSVLTEYLISIGVDKETAAQDACRIEHVVSEQSFERIKKEYTNKTD
jgi:Mn-dependent transcriptional regulator